MRRFWILLFALLPLVPGCGGGGGHKYVAVTDVRSLPGMESISAVLDVNDSGEFVGYSEEFMVYLPGIASQVMGWVSGQAATIGGKTDRAIGPYGINNAGKIAAAPGSRAAVWTGGSSTALPVPVGYHDSRAHDINDGGDAVGAAALQGTRVYPFLWESGGQAVVLSTPGQTTGVALAINASRDIVGWGDVSSGRTHALMWRNGSVQDLGVLPGHVSSQAVDINQSGTVVGFCADASGSEHAFLWRDGEMKGLGAPGGLRSCASAVNDSGTIVGYAEIPSARRHAFIWRGGPMLDLNSFVDPSAGWELAEARSISNTGWIVGSGVHNGRHTQFIMRL